MKPADADLGPGDAGDVIQVVDVPRLHRFQARLGDQVAGFAAYRRIDGAVVFTHTEVDPGYEGRGVGGALVCAALTQVRDAGLDVVPVCPFVSDWLRRHPDFAATLHLRDPRAGGAR